MKTKVCSSPILSFAKQYRLANCKTILQSVTLYIMAASLLFNAVGCSPTTVNNHNTPPSDSGDSERTQDVINGGGTGDGGGGQGIQCTNKTLTESLRGKIMVRDIYEAKFNYKREMNSNNLADGGTIAVDEVSIQRLSSAIKSYFGPASNNLEFSKDSFWSDFAKQISFVPKNSELFPSRDANSPIALPKGCNIVQIAYWDESSGPNENGTLYVDQEKWQQLDQFNKIALLAHEYFYKQARRSGFKNSDFIRYKIGQLLSIEGLEPIFKDWNPAKDQRIKDLLPESINGFKYCEGTSNDDPEAYLQMYQFEDTNKKQVLAFPIIKSTKINNSLLQATTVTFDPKQETKLTLALDLFTPTSDFKDDLTTLVYNNSSIEEENRWLNLRYSNSGFISDFGFGGFRQALREKLQVLASQKNPIWTTTVSTKNLPLKISIINPAPDQSIEVSLKTKEEIINVINQKIQTDLEHVNWTIEFESDPRRMKILAAIATLNNEVDIAVNSGIFPEKFSRWISSLEELNNLIPTMRAGNGGALYSEKSKYDENKDLTEKYPNWLYMIKSNSYSIKDIEQTIGSDALNINRKNSIFEIVHQASIKLEQDSNSVIYNLNCIDYNTIFNKRTFQEKYSGKFNNSINHNVRYLFDLKKFSLENDYGGNAYERLNIYKFIRYMNSSDLSSNLDSTLSYDNNCPTNEAPRIRCNNLNEFITDLSSEYEIELTPCTSYGPYSDPREDAKQNLRTSCVIMNLKGQQQRYLAVFTFHQKSSLESNGRNESANYYKIPDLHFLMRIP